MHKIICLTLVLVILTAGIALAADAQEPIEAPEKTCSGDTTGFIKNPCSQWVFPAWLWLAVRNLIPLL